MDGPLFGETSQQSKVCQYAIYSIVIVSMLESIILAVYFGISKPFFPHFFMIGVLAINMFILVMMVKWYQNGDLDPKFKLFIFLILGCLVVTVITSNLFSILAAPDPASKECNEVDKGWFTESTTGLKRCLTISTIDRCLARTPGF